MMRATDTRRIALPTRRRGVHGFAITLAVCLASTMAGAQAEETSEAAFASATRALSEGRAGDSVAAFEALADRGIVNAVASYDRGLAYALRVHLAAERPGDLGQAVHGFEEARDLSKDPRLVDDASRALAIVRSEVARRRVRAGQPAAVEPGPSLSRTLARLFPEAVWEALCVAASLALALGLLVRWFTSAVHLRVGGGVFVAIAAPVLFVASLMTLAARHDRLSVREAVVVATPVRPTDERGLSLPGADPLPEGARVELLDMRGPSARIRFGALDAWVPSGALRELARRE